MNWKHWMVYAIKRYNERSHEKGNKKSRHCRHMAGRQAGRNQIKIKITESVNHSKGDSNLLNRARDGEREYKYNQASELSYKKELKKSTKMNNQLQQQQQEQQQKK